MDVSKLCEMITMPYEVIREADKWNAKEYREALEHFWIMIQDSANWDAALEEVRKLFPDDTNGLKCLLFMLQEGVRAYEVYMQKGISLKVYLDTMGCFSRFVKEYYESYKTYGFDREWWTVRQLTLREFRLGELEYEMIEDNGSRIISVHIPSDARLEEQNCRESYRKADLFFKEFAVDYATAPYTCESWLLSPKLNELLPADSKIIRFQGDFIPDSYEPEDTGYMQWVFKNDKLTLDEVPQQTSLQRKMKAYLKNGGKIGAGRGHIKKELFE